VNWRTGRLPTISRGSGRRRSEQSGRECDEVGEEWRRVQWGQQLMLRSWIEENMGEEQRILRHSGTMFIGEKWQH